MIKRYQIDSTSCSYAKRKYLTRISLLFVLILHSSCTLNLDLKVKNGLSKIAMQMAVIKRSITAGMKECGEGSLSPSVLKGNRKS
jgi:hypothetical protein